MRAGSTAVGVLTVAATVAAAQLAGQEPGKPATTAHVRDGQHDFDFLLGRWTFHLRRLEKPLTGSTTWRAFDGTAWCRPVLGGRAQIDEISLDGPAGKVEGLTLRTYNPLSGQWSLHWANVKDGLVGVPTVGGFENGRGEFYNMETFAGRVILVRYVWSDVTPTSAHFEQAFSTDGGKTWETNWITDQVRVPSPEDSARP
jgi:hypothetical protein